MTSHAELIEHLREFLRKHPRAAADAAREFPGKDEPKGVDLEGILRKQLGLADNYGQQLATAPESSKSFARDGQSSILQCDESYRFDQLQWASEDFYYFGSPRDEDFAIEASEAYRAAWEQATRKLLQDFVLAWEAFECAAPCHKKWGEEDEMPRRGEEEFARELRARLRRSRRETQTPEQRLLLLVLGQLDALVVARIQRVGRLVYRASLRARLTAALYCDREGPADPPPPAP